MWRRDGDRRRPILFFIRPFPTVLISGRGGGREGDWAIPSYTSYTQNRKRAARERPTSKTARDGYRATKTIRHTKHFSIIAQLMHFAKTAHLYSSRRLSSQWSETLCVLLLLPHDTAQTSRVCTECSVRERPRRRPHEKSGGAEIGGLSSLPFSHFLCDKSPSHGSP